MEKEGIKITNEAKAVMETFLRSKGMSFDALSPGKRERYMKVADAVFRYKDIRSLAKQTIKEHPINISSITAETGLSNKTFYNDKVLHEFVAVNSTDSGKEKSAADKAIREKLEKAEAQNKKLVRNAIETQLLKEEIRELEKDNAHLQERLDASEMLIDQLQAELIKLKTPHECSIIDIQTGERTLLVNK